jgi:hypothetical protein
VCAAKLARAKSRSDRIEALQAKLDAAESREGDGERWWRAGKTDLDD